MKSERYKQIMKAIGMENSISLMLGLEQVANEVEQEVRKELGDREFWKEKYIRLAELCASSKLENYGLVTRCEPNTDVKQLLKNGLGSDVI